MMTVEEQRAMGDIHPGLKKLFDGNTPRMTGWKKNDTVKAGRQFLRFIREQQKAVRPPRAKASWIEVESEIAVPDWATATSDSGPRSLVNLKIKVYKPKKIPKGGCPAMVSCGGGDSILYDFEMMADMCHRWTTLGGIAIDIGHRLAPEFQFPIPIYDCYEGLKWVAQNIQDLGLDPEKGFVVAGETRGADFALTCAHLYTQAGTSPPLTGIYASMPLGVSKETLPEKYQDRFFSFEQCAKAPQTMDLESFEFSRAQYNPDPTSPLAYPVAFPDQSYLPKTYFQVCGLDPTRDCGIILEQVLKDAGVETKLDTYPGLTHNHWLNFEQFPWASKAISDSTAGLKWLLKKDD